MTTDTPTTTISEGWLKREAAADVLDTIANLSNDEVFTPPKLARQVLDLLPEHVWKDSSLKFLDPCVKTGVFLREIVKRLMVGLADEFPCEKERREHILRHQIYGIAITDLTALMSRRTVYCASDATREPNPDYPENCYSAVKFDDPEGNIVFPPAHHDWDKVDEVGNPREKAKCKICGASAKDFGGEDREGMESYAYPFIHMDMEEIWGKEMKFDVIIGNPPYQISDGAGANGISASPLYHKFIEKSKDLSPEYISFIIPARWYSGGKGLDDFRYAMMSDKSLKTICDVPIANECFPGVDIAGGVCYFLWDNKHTGLCEFRSISGGKCISTVKRSAKEFDIIIRSNDAINVVRRVVSSSCSFVDKITSAQKPFGFRSNFSDYSDSYFEGSVKIYARGHIGWIHRDAVKVNPDWIDSPKVLISKAFNVSCVFPHPIMAKPTLELSPACCTETYIVAGRFETKEKAESYFNYTKTKFFRYMMHLRKPTQNISRSCFGFVPNLDFAESWTDEKLYAHFGLTQVEIDLIEATIKEMP